MIQSAPRSGKKHQNKITEIMLAPLDQWQLCFLYKLNTKPESKRDKAEPSWWNPKGKCTPFCWPVLLACPNVMVVHKRLSGGFSWRGEEGVADVYSNDLTMKINLDISHWCSLAIFVHLNIPRSTFRLTTRVRERRWSLGLPFPMPRGQKTAPVMIGRGDWEARPRIP